MRPDSRETDAGARSVARVVLVPPVGRVGILDYQVPAGGALVCAGMRVLAPVGPRRHMGVVVETVRESDYEGTLRELVAVLDPEPVLDRVLLSLVRWLAEYYLASLGEAMATALPGALRIETERQARLADAWQDYAPRGDAERTVIGVLHADGPLSTAALRRRLGGAAGRVVDRLRRKGVVVITERVRRETAPTRREQFYEIRPEVADAQGRLTRAPALRRLYALIRDHPQGRISAGEIRASFPQPSAKLRALIDKGLIRAREEERYRDVLPAAVGADRAVTLTRAQRVAVEAVNEVVGKKFEPFLLFGVTGSGKTEVYLRTVAVALAAGRSVLILVPEISLTHQLVDRVRARFGERVAVLHSQLSIAERWDQWRRIARGAAPIVIGARSAVFAPLRRLGLVVVDEEHDSAYKQGDGVRYQGRDVAVVRAKMTGCPVVLGSATPSMESYHNASIGRYHLLELGERVESRPLPAVETIDLRQVSPPAVQPISRSLDAALQANLIAGGQSLLFLNRRGFSNFLQCRACGDPIMCPNCSVTLTWHRRSRTLRCHYCDHAMQPPSLCPSCGESALEKLGIGTEQAESMLREALPGARVGRMDRDTTRRKGSQAALLRDWSAGRLDVLVGTQMVTKGHDVRGVTLVGVLLADMSLNFPDFRAAERTFQLLAQVAGRAGRGDRPGRVIVQTLQPEHYALRAAAEHDFRTFAEREFAVRGELSYPPFSRLILMRFEGVDLDRTSVVAREATSRLRARSRRRFLVLGPAPAPLERLRLRYRFQTLVRGKSGAAIRTAVGHVVGEMAREASRQEVRLIADVDPYDML